MGPWEQSHGKTMAIPFRKVIDYKFYDNITYNEIPHYQPLLYTTLYKSLKNSLLFLSSLFIKKLYCKKNLIISLCVFIFQLT